MKDLKILSGALVFALCLVYMVIAYCIRVPSQWVWIPPMLFFALWVIILLILSLFTKEP